MAPTTYSPVPLTALLCLALAALPASGGGDQPPAPEMPRFDDARLRLGRSVWMQACRSCHLLGVNGVLGMLHFEQWGERLRLSREQLYRSVIAGMTKPDGTVVMPPRGGNARLSDMELEAAVDYTLAAVAVLRDSELH